MRFVIVLILVAFLAFSFACRPAAAPVAVSDRPVSNDRMPRLNLPMPPTKPLEKLGWLLFKGGEKKLMEDYRGKVLILDFWATYCGPCIEGIPHLRKLKEKYGKDNLNNKRKEKNRLSNSS